MTIKCKGLKELQIAQKNLNKRFVNIGFAPKTENGFHKGHLKVIDSARKKWPKAALMIAMWSDDWWENYYNKKDSTFHGNNELDIDYCFQWAENKVDMIYIFDYEDQKKLFENIPVKYFDWATDIFNKEKYTHKNTTINAALKWMMAISEWNRENEFIKRDYSAMGDKNGWANYVQKHFYEKYTEIQEVLLIETVYNGALPYSTNCINKLKWSEEKINIIEHPILGNKRIIEHYIPYDDGTYCINEVIKNDRM